MSMPWSDSPYAPKIPYSVYAEEKSDVAGILIAAILYGVLIVLFFQCMDALFSPANRRGEGIKWGLVIYTVLMFSFATILTGMGLNIESLSYIDNREFPGGEGIPPGPLGYRLSVWSGALTVTPRLAFLFNNWLADGLLLYRCYIIFSANLWIIVIPFLVSLGSVATGLLSVFLGGLEARRRFYAVNVSTSLSLNILLTLMIVVRLILHSRDIRAILGAPLSGTSRLYTTIITMLIESCALFAVNSLLVIGLLFTDNHAANTFLAILAIIQVIAPLLIIRRVADRSALTSNTAGSGAISSLKVRNQVELTGVSAAFSGGNPKGSVGGCGTSSGELEVEVVTDFHRDSKV